MSQTPMQPQVPLQIKTPCPKSWDQLSGGEAKRYCSECCLHVHNAAQLTRVEAEELVAKSSERVCMRMQFDESGAPLFRETPAPERRRLRLAGRATRWALATAAGLLAACHRSESVNPPVDSGRNPGSAQTTTKMGKVAGPELMGDVATPEPPRQLLGEVFVPTPPQPPPETNQPPPSHQ